MPQQPRDEALAPQTVAAINELYRRADELYHEVARRAGFADCAFEILYSLMMRDGLTQKQLCGTSYSTKQTVSSSIKRLREDGLVETRGEGRERTVHLTRAGKAAVRKRIRPVYEAECAAVEVFTPAKQKRLIAETARYLESLSAQLDALEL